MRLNYDEHYPMEAYQLLEQKFAEFNGVEPKCMVACSSGTAALHLALEALRLPLGSLVLVPDFAMVACARAAVLAGHVPVFVDCDSTLNLDVTLLQEAPEGIRAVMVVHTYGRSVDMEQVYEIADKRDWFVIEDLAELHGVPPGRDTDMACWSFYRNKVIAGEEGGAVYTRHREAATTMRSLRSLGFTEAHDFWHNPRGHNYRMSNLHAEAVLRSLEMYRANRMARIYLEGVYDQYCPKAWRLPRRRSPWVYDFRPISSISQKKIQSGCQLDPVIAALQSEGIPARHGFKPLHLQPEFNHECQLIQRIEEIRIVKVYPVSHSCIASKTIMYLPIQPRVTTEADIKRAFDVLRKYHDQLVEKETPAEPGLEKGEGNETKRLDGVTSGDEDAG